jgi:hypothetical protein
MLVARKRLCIDKRCSIRTSYFPMSPPDPEGSTSTGITGDRGPPFIRAHGQGDR